MKVVRHTGFNTLIEECGIAGSAGGRRLGKLKLALPRLNVGTVRADETCAKAGVDDGVV